MEEVEVAGADFSASLTKVTELETGLCKLAQVLQRTGQQLKEAFADAALVTDADEATKDLAEFFVAWREVGDASVTFASQAEGICKMLRELSEKGASERTQRIDQAKNLTWALEAKAHSQPSGGGLLSSLFRGGSRPPDAEQEAAAQAKAEALRATTTANLELLAQNMAEARERFGAEFKKQLGDVRRHTKSLGEKLVVLRPSWKGSSGRTSANSGSPGQSSGGGGGGVPKGKKVENLIRSLSTVEGRKEVVSRDEGVALPVTATEAPLSAPPAEKLSSNGEWRIHGIYDHQCLKAGLRVLDEQLPLDGLEEFAQKRDGSSALFRETLVRDLIAGKLRIQSIMGNDIATAQRDLGQLNLRQLLRMRVHHLDYVPSGCGADTVHSVGGTQEAFVNVLDGLVFKLLGRKAMQDLPDTSALDEHKLGREAVQLVAAGAAVPAPVWWCWWITDTRRVFFDPHHFLSSASFPSSSGGTAGVLEITDNSKKDHHDPSGRLRWMDWRLQVITKEEDLSSTPCRPNQAVATSGGAAGEATADLDPSSPSRKKAALSLPVAQSAAEDADNSKAAGTATAGMVSPTLLKDMRQGLRKTGTLNNLTKNMPKS